MVRAIRILLIDILVILLIWLVLPRILNALTPYHGHRLYCVYGICQ